MNQDWQTTNTVWHRGDGDRIRYAYEYRRPALTVDLVALNETSILLIRRKFDPFAGCLALPGGYVNYGEGAADAAIREFEEEVSLSITTDRLRPVPAFTNPGRDPRGWVVSVPFIVKLTKQEFESAEAADDAASIVRFDLLSFKDPGPFAFDHAEIINAALGGFYQRTHR